MGEGPSSSSPLELTEDQRQRVEANRLRALAKRKAFLDQQQEGQLNHCWRLFKCRKFYPEARDSVSSKSIARPSSPHNPIIAKPETPLPKKFRVRLEICSPDSFSVAHEPVQGFSYPGQVECSHMLEDWLSNVMSTHYTQIHDGGKASVYKLKDYDAVLKCLRSSKGIEIEEIPWTTYNVMEKLSHSYVARRWIPCRPEHLPDEKVEELINALPRKLLGTLLPFQLDGLKFGLQRGGCCLIADEMGLGKTLQAIAIASCFTCEGSILVVCPAILRYSWAEELERWFPYCLPADIHLVCGHRNNPANLPRCPKVVVISYTMLHRLRKSILEFEWAVLIVDESHHVRCSKKKAERGEIKAVLDVSAKVKRLILLSGTPSLSRPFDIFHQINMLWPGLLGKHKYEFAKTYCSVKFGRGSQGRVFQDFSQGSRLEELNILLRQTVMIRRLKEHLLVQLPAKRRQIITLLLKRSDIVQAQNAVQVHNDSHVIDGDGRGKTLEISDKANGSGCHRSGRKLSGQVLGIAKVSGFIEWLSLHPVVTEVDGSRNLDMNLSSHKMIIFAHHHKVLDRVQEFICQKGIGFVRIDKNTLDRDRQSAVQSFQSSKEVKVAMIGIKVGYAGLNLSAAQSVVFLELPKEPTALLQAEDRAHRRGQTNSVNIYIFRAKDTCDESRWTRLNKSLHCVSSTTDGKYDAVKEILIDGVDCLENSGNTDGRNYGILDNATAVCVDYSADCSMENPEANDVVRGKVDDTFHGTKGAEDNKLYERVDEESCSRQGIVDDMHEKLHEGYDSIPATSLRFAVSQYTGRIHLCTCIPEVDSRPRPLSENFRPEDIMTDCNNKKAFASIKLNQECCDAVLTFIKEWKKLKPIDRRKLLGKPLQLPLTTELSYLNESANYDTRGLLRGGSKRRTTPVSDISCPVPSNAVWKEVTLCGGYGRKERTYIQAWTMADEPLCKLCQSPCKNINAKKPEFFEDLFCKLACYEEYRSRTSQRFLREQLFQIEHGICTNCQLDCHKLVEHIRPLLQANREEYIIRVAPNLAKYKKLLNKLVCDPTEGNAWHADHVVPVYKGGGECRVENMRTLCVACHADVTSAQCAERRLARKQLKNVMTAIKNNHKKQQTCADLTGEGYRRTADDDLLIKIPGSAYSEVKQMGSKDKVLDYSCMD
ncbi:hypothetical protein Ancab_035984 [Ancistrocladus abbreviatus]